MKIYKSSDLTHKRAEVLKEAKANGVIIQQLETNGEVRQEFVLLDKEKYIDKLMSPDITIDDQYLIANVNNEYKPLDFTTNKQWDDGIISGDRPKYKFDNIRKALKEIEGDL